MSLGRKPDPHTLDPQVASAGALPTIISAMRTHPEVEDVQKFGTGAIAICCGALPSLARAVGDNEALRLVECGGGGEVVRHAMGVFGGNAVIQEKGRLLLERMSGVGCESTGLPRL